MSFPGFNYIGSKTKLLSFIKNCIESYTGKNLCDIQSFFDGFSGTGSVSYYMISKGVSKVITNDIQYYSYIISSVLTSNNIDIQKVKGIVSDLDNLDFSNPTEKDFIYNNYTTSTGCDRMYFTQSNAIKIDRIRQHIESLFTNNKIEKTEYNLLLKLLLYAVTKISNTSSTYGAYLKQFKPSSLKSLTLDKSLIDYLHNGTNASETTNKSIQHFSYNMNILELLDSDESNDSNDLEVCYIDPPYNSRDYSSNYHLLETIAKYDYPTIRGKTGLRDNSSQKSNYCSKTNASNEFKKLFGKIKSQYLFLSYSSESIVSKSEMISLLDTNWYDIKCFEKEYQRFKSNSNGDQNKTVTEYIFAAKRRT